RFDRWEWARWNLEPEMRRRATVAKPDARGKLPSIVSLTRRWFPTEEELLLELDRLEEVDRRHRGVAFARWWDTFAERSCTEDDAFRVLCAWVAKNPSSSRFVDAVGLIGDRGKRRSLAELLRLKPAGDDLEVIRAVADAEFAVRRRTLD